MRVRRRSVRARAFSIAELIVVVGVLALLMAIVLPPIQQARVQAMHAHCSAQLQQLGRALETAFTEHGYYPYWDDGGVPIRYTWIDVLIQLRLLGSSGSFAARPVGADGAGAAPTQYPGDASRIGYCPLDARPDSLNALRNCDLVYPPTGRLGGIDYSYGIGVPLAAGGWNAPPHADDVAAPRRRFREHDLRTSGRVLAGDAYSSAINNLSGNALTSGIWNDPTQFDNTVAWQRHGLAGDAGAANLLFQDGHVSRTRYSPHATEPLNTSLAFVWRPGESLYVGPDDSFDGDGYPNQLPPSYAGAPAGNVFPNELLPRWYTDTNRWTLIGHK
jgi:prepilin-type processing-associated H-X9-DG protein